MNWRGKKCSDHILEASGLGQGGVVYAKKKQRNRTSSSKLFEAQGARGLT